MNYKNYSFFKGEDACPFNDSGRAFWWRLEKEAATNVDAKNPGELSSTMWGYLREKMWQGDAHPDTSEKEFRERARRLYSLGLWSRLFITTADYPLSSVVGERL